MAPNNSRRLVKVARANEPLLCFPDPMPSEWARPLQDAGYDLACVNGAGAEGCGFALAQRRHHSQEHQDQQSLGILLGQEGSVAPRRTNIISSCWFANYECAFCRGTYDFERSTTKVIQDPSRAPMSHCYRVFFCLEDAFSSTLGMIARGRSALKRFSAST